MAAGRDVVELDGYAIICGAESVGLPATWSTDTLMERYLDLVHRVRGGVGVQGLRDGDIEVLAAATGLDPGCVRQRLERMARIARC